jgi:hypothetical protein
MIIAKRRCGYAPERGIQEKLDVWREQWGVD